LGAVFNRGFFWEGVHSNNNSKTINKISLEYLVPESKEVPKEFRKLTNQPKKSKNEVLPWWSHVKGIQKSTDSTNEWLKLE
jgi:hypothetical protein